MSTAGPGQDGLADCEVVLVTYHSRPHVEALQALLPDDLRMVVVDNAQGADGVQDVVAGHPHARYLTGPGRGFASGANLGAGTSTADYLIFVNPDSRPDVAVLTALVADLRADPKLGGVAALVVDTDSWAERGAGGWEFTPGRAFVHASGLHRLLRHSGLYVRPNIGEPVDVDWVTGACFAVPRAVFTDVGGFDESFFVYCEDVDFGNRLRTAGYRIALRTDLTVLHGAGESGAGRSTMQRLKGASFVQYVVRLNGPATGNLIRVAMVAGFGVRLLIAAVTGRRAVVAEHKYYLQGLLFGRGDLA